MAFVAPALTAISGATAGVGGLSSLLAVGGTIFSTLSQYQAGKYQQAVLNQQAATAEENAKRERFAGQVEQQDRDFEALAVIGQERAFQGARGFSLSSGSVDRRLRLSSIMARRDSLRIRNEAEVRATNYQADAAGARAEAAQAGRSAKFGLIEGAFGVGSDLISGAARVNQKKAAAIRRDSIDSGFY